MKYTLAEIADINKFSISKSDNLQEIIYLDTSSITENFISGTCTMPLPEAPSRAQRKVKSNTIVYSTVRPRLKHYGILNSPPYNLIVSSGFVTIDLKKEYEDKIDARYLFLLLTQPAITEYIACIADSAVSAYPSFNPSDISEIAFSFPNIEKQKAISEIWSNFEQKISINRRINDNLEAMAKQLYNYWFVQFDFPNEEGKPYKSSGGAMVWNEKLKREIPTSFDVKSLSEIIEVKDGTHDSPKPQDNGYFLLTSKHLTERGLDYASAYKISKEDYESINKRSKVDTNDILFSMIGTIGNSYFVEETKINFAIKNMALFKTSAKRWFSEYMYLYLSSCDYKHYEGNSLSGSIQKFVSLRTLRDMPILYHEDIIKVFAKEVRNIITMMVNLRKENIELTKQRDELLPLLMNGQASVNSD